MSIGYQYAFNTLTGIIASLEDSISSTVDFEFEEYTPPSGGAVDFEFGEGGATTWLSPSATPGRRYAITAKAEAPDPVVVTPTTASFSTTTFAPTVSVSIVVPSASLTTASFAPTVLTPRLVTPATLALVLTTFEPLAGDGIVNVTPDTLALVTASFEPTIGFGIGVVPDTLALVLSTFAPSVLTPVVVTPATLALLLGTFAPGAELSRALRIAWAELEIPNAPRALRIAWAAFEVPNTLFATLGGVVLAAGNLVSTHGDNVLPGSDSGWNSFPSMVESRPLGTDRDYILRTTGGSRVRQFVIYTSPATFTALKLIQGKVVSFTDWYGDTRNVYVQTIRRDNGSRPWRVRCTVGLVERY